MTSCLPSQYEYREYQEALDILDQAENSFITYGVPPLNTSPEDFQYCIPSENVSKHFTVHFNLILDNVSFVHILMVYR